MSHVLQWYGTTDTIYFKLTLAGVGVNVTLAADDVKLSKDGGTPANVITTPTAVDGTSMPGLYVYTPSAAESTCEVMIINIKDASAGGAFDENCLIIPTGGNASARYGG